MLCQTGLGFRDNNYLFISKESVSNQLAHSLKSIKRVVSHYIRTGKKATIITTNLAFNRWSEVIEDKILVTALIDRLTHRAHLINMTGVSYRLKETQNMLN